MKAKIKGLSEILNDKLSLSQRGLLITILLLKEEDPKLTLAKVKAKVKMSDAKKDLIELHEMGLIEWSGYKTALRTKFDTALFATTVEVIDYMNELYNRNFNIKSKSTTTNLMNRLKEYSLEEIKLVVANRYAEWKDDRVMRKYLTPHTIFRPSKFDKYLEEAKRTSKGESLLNAAQIKLKKGDEITFEISEKFIDQDIYVLRVFPLKKGKKSGSGRIEKKYGKDFKRSMKIIDNQRKQGAEITTIYFYEGE